MSARTINRRKLLIAGLVSGFPARAVAQAAEAVGAAAMPGRPPDPVETIDLWPTAAPEHPRSASGEVVYDRSTDPAMYDRTVVGITRPRMVVFRAVAATGAAVLLIPGGGYRWLAIDKEGYDLGRWLSARGVTVFVLLHRLPGEGWTAGPDVVLQDGQRAMRMIRHRARDFGVDPGHVVAMGFSAGGHACADLAARFAWPVHEPVDSIDRLSARPDLAAPIYPVISMHRREAHLGSREKLLGKRPSQRLEQTYSPHHNIPYDAPPHFLLHCEDDDVVPVENTLLLRSALKAKNVLVETHLFGAGGHGFGLRRVAGKPVAAWPELLLTWVKARA